MPNIKLIISNNTAKGGSQFEFDPSDYFLFPTAKFTTRATSAWFGLEWVNVTETKPVKDDEFYLGMLFFKKYQFTVSFDYSDSVPEMTIMIPADPI